MTDKDEPSEAHVEVKAQDARAGGTGRPVLYVLIGTIVLVAIGLYFAFGASA